MFENLNALKPDLHVCGSCCAGITVVPIQLIQVGEAYFVRDRHHRISVSRAFGQMAKEAEVITWKAAPPFPWQPDACCATNKTLLTPES